MMSFLVNFIRFGIVIFKGIRNDSEFRFLVIFLILLLIGSTTFYVNIEGWSIVDSLYFSVMTMSTVGYGDFTPSTDLSKLFTILFTFLSIGAFVSVTAKMIDLTILSRKNRIAKFKERRKKLMSE